MGAIKPNARLAVNLHLNVSLRRQLDFMRLTYQINNDIAVMRPRVPYSSVPKQSRAMFSICCFYKALVCLFMVNLNGFLFFSRAFLRGSYLFVKAFLMGSYSFRSGFCKENRQGRLQCVLQSGTLPRGRFMLSSGLAP